MSAHIMSIPIEETVLPLLPAGAAIRSSPRSRSPVGRASAACDSRSATDRPEEISDRPSEYAHRASRLSALLANIAQQRGRETRLPAPRTVLKCRRAVCPTNQVVRIECDVRSDDNAGQPPADIVLPPSPNKGRGRPLSLRERAVVAAADLVAARANGDRATESVSVSRAVARSGDCESGQRPRRRPRCRFRIQIGEHHYRRPRTLAAAADEKER